MFFALLALCLVIEFAEDKIVVVADPFRRHFGFLEAVVLRLDGVAGVWRVN